MRYEHRTTVDQPVSMVFDWHERKGAFQRLMPQWEVAQLVYADDDLSDGSIRKFRFPMGPVKMTWESEHLGYEPPNKFEDIMRRGPFRSWHHIHRFDRLDGRTVVTDQVDYRLPLGPLGRIFGGRMVSKRIQRMFKSREKRLIQDLDRHAEFAYLPRKRILIAGSSGLIGTQLVAFLDTGGHDVWRLVRREVGEGEKEIRWDPENGIIDKQEIEGFDIIIHLGGVGIGDKRWSKKRKLAIKESRLVSTRLLAETIASLDSKPESFMLASAIGWYGDRGDEELTESSDIGDGFLPGICKEWEASASLAREAGIRTIHLRSGIVLSAVGGALGRMLLPFKLGGGGPIGRGRQWMSWITLDDQVYAIHHLLMSKDSEGIYNLTAPNPVRQRDFAKNLGRVLRRPSFMPLPKFAIRMMFGEMGVKLTLDSQRVYPERLLKQGYRFLHDNLEEGLRDALGMWK